MKKLMTMIAAATAAFGLYAADPVEALHGASMETDEGYTVGGGVVGVVDKNWVTDAEADESVVTAYGEETAPDHLNYDVFEGAQLNYLKVEAEQPLYRAIEDATGTKTENLVPADIAVEGERDGIIIDQLVKFSAFDAETEKIDVEAGAKIAVWVKADEEDDTTGTLQITTAALDAETAEPTETTINTEIEVAVADWHQLKITTIKAADIAGDVIPGFIIELDDEVVNKADGLFPLDGAAAAFYTDAAKELIAQNKLFPSMVVYGSTGADTLVGVAYKGTGSIDDVAVANYVAEAPATTTINVALADGVTAEVEPGTFEDGKWTFPAGTATGTITLTAPDGKLFKSNGSDTLVLENVDLTNGDLDYSDEEVDTAAAKIGTILYLTLKKAVDAAQANDEITLLADCTGDGIKIDKSITIDFDGKTYTVDASLVGSPSTKSQAFNLVRGNTITLKNGTIVSTVARMLVQNYASLTLDNMILDGENLAAVDGNGNAYVAYTLSNCAGNTVIQGNSIIKARSLAKSFAFDTWYKAGKYEDATVTVNGASIYGDIELAGGSLTLTAGTLDGALVEGDNIEKGIVTKDDAFEADAPAGYKWDEDGVLVKVVEPETYDITITAPKNGTLETSVTNDVEVGTTVTVTATPDEGYELESITVNDVALEKDVFTFEMPAEDVTVAATFKKVGGYPPEWPKTDEDTKAKFAAWVATKGADADLSTVDAKDAFLLNCTVNGLKDAKDAFKITSIEFVEGAWVIGEPEGDFNGKVVTKAFDAVVDGEEVIEPTGDETELFWKAFLVFPTAE